MMRKWAADLPTEHYGYVSHVKGRYFETVRSDNWNEMMGTLSTSDVTFLVGNCASDQRLQSTTSRTFLDNPGVRR